MVTRTAFTQLGYSGALLALVCLLMLILFLVPWLAMLLPSGWPALASGAAALFAMAGVFWPTVRFYGLPFSWAFTLPLAAMFFLAMTIESAMKYWRGTRAEWKGRRYAAR
jgi:hypothetical protein